MAWLGFSFRCAMPGRTRSAGRRRRHRPAGSTARRETGVLLDALSVRAIFPYNRTIRRKPLICQGFVNPGPRSLGKQIAPALPHLRTHSRSAGAPSLSPSLFLAVAAGLHRRLPYGPGSPRLFFSDGGLMLVLTTRLRDLAGVAPREDQLPSEARPQNQARRPARGTVGPTCSACFWSRRRPSTSCRNWSRLAFTSARSWRKPKTSTSRIRGSRVNSSRRSPVDRVEPPRFSETSPGRLRAWVCAGADRADLRCLRPSIIADISPRESGPGVGVSWSFDSPPR